MIKDMQVHVDGHLDTIRRFVDFRKEIKHWVENQHLQKLLIWNN